MKIGDTIIKETGDYTFTGEIRAILTKKSGATRLVGENAEGLLFIFNPQHVKVIPNVDIHKNIKD